MDQSFQSQTPLPQTPPKNWLVESILVTLFCCLPFGIAGIVFATQVNSKFAAGDYNGALQASRDAARWTKIGFWAGIVVIIAYAIFAMFFGGLAILSGRNRSY
ncbi:MAG: CD225/dispanin family protein [Segetibacter sp.]